MRSPLSFFLLFTIITSVIVGIEEFQELRTPFYVLLISVVIIKNYLKVNKENTTLFFVIFATYPLVQFLVLQGDFLSTIQAIVMVLALFFVGKFAMHQKINKKQLEVIARFLTFGMFTFYYNTAEFNARFSGLFGNPNSTAYVSLVLLPLIFMFSSSKKLKSIAIINVVFLMFYTASRGALMSFLLGVLAYYIVEKRNMMFLGIWGTALLCLLLAVYGIDIATFLVETFITSEEIKSNTRILRLDANGRDVITSLAFDRFFSSGTEFFGLGFENAKFDIGEGIGRNAGTHNSFIEVLIRLGYIGVSFSVLYLFFLTKKIAIIKNVNYRAIIGMQLSIFMTLSTNASLFMVLNYYFFYLIILIEIGVLKDKDEANLSLSIMNKNLIYNKLESNV